MASSSGRVLVYGGRGALGSNLVMYMKSQNIWVASIDLFANEEANANVLVDPALTWTGQNESVCSQVGDVLNGEKVDAIFCVAGGWAGGNAASKDLVKNADLMVKQSVWTSVISAGLASKFLKEGGLLTLTGAHPAQKATPGMMGYGLAKAAVHQFVNSLAAPKSGMPEKSSVAAILPVTLDTPMNRKFMPNADHSTWTPLQYVAKLLHEWMQGKDRPSNGALVQLVTKDGQTELINA